MSFMNLKVDASSENVRDMGGSSNYINKSGMYEILIKHIIVDTSPSGSTYINMLFEYNGQEQIIYQALRLTNKNGSFNLEKKLFDKFCIIAGADDGMEINDPVPMMLPVGKGKEMKECMVLEDFDDVPVIIRLEMEYSLWEGKIMEKKVIKNFFRVTDHATAMEIVNNVDNKGKQYDLEVASLEKKEYASTYKDGLTKEDVDEYIKNRTSGSKTEDKSTAPSFGQKRSFARK